MPGNPKDSAWRSTPREKRKRKPIEITLPDASLELLAELSAASGEHRSRVIERALELYAEETIGGAKRDETSEKTSENKKST